MQNLNVKKGKRGKNRKQSLIIHKVLQVAKKNLPLSFPEEKTQR